MLYNYIVQKNQIENNKQKEPILNIYTYQTSGGKDLIINYLDSLPKNESAEGYYIMEQLEKRGISFLQMLNTRQLSGKLWEIKFRKNNRIMYILLDKDNMYLLHACKKQKGKAERFELNKAKRRAKKII